MGTGKLSNAFVPRFPIYMIGSERAPVIVSVPSKQFALGFSNRELAELVATQMAARKTIPIGILAYSDHRSFVDTVVQLIPKGVTHMSWDLTGNSKSGYFVDLNRLVRDWSVDVN